MCMSCGVVVPNEELPWVAMYDSYVVGEVVSTDAIKGKKLLKLEVNLGGESPVVVVTSDVKVAAGDRIVVARPGAMVPAGSNEDSGGELVKKAPVSGGCSDVEVGWWRQGCGSEAAQLGDWD